MKDFENQINTVFDVNFKEELYKNEDTINEGMLGDAYAKAKSALANVIRSGVEKVLPDELIKFLKGLTDAAKKSPEDVAEFLGSVNPEMANEFAMIIGSMSEEDAKKLAKSAEEEAKDVDGGSDIADLAARNAEVGQFASDLGSGMSWGATGILAVIGLASAYGLYRAIRRGVLIWRDTQKRFGGSGKGKGKRR